MILYSFYQTKENTKKVYHNTKWIYSEISQTSILYWLIINLSDKTYWKRSEKYSFDT